MIITLHNGIKEKRCKIGFSWTTLFFRWFVPLFRGDWLWVLIIGLLVPSLPDETWRGIGFEIRFYTSPNSWLTLSFTIGMILTLFFAFMYNRIYILGLLKKGYTSNLEDREVLIQNDFIDNEGNIKPLFRRLYKKDLNTIGIILGSIIVFYLFIIIVHLFTGNFHPHFEIIRLPIR